MTDKATSAMEDVKMDVKCKDGTVKEIYIDQDYVISGYKGATGTTSWEWSTNTFTDALKEHGMKDESRDKLLKKIDSMIPKVLKRWSESLDPEERAIFDKAWYACIDNYGTYKEHKENKFN